jgi:sigma-E factor negative regulatory protein RseA
MVERERISALMDGELTDEEFAGRIQQLKSEEGAEDWRTYHLIGDVLRGDSMFSSMPPSMSSSRFAEKLGAALAAEPTVLAPAAVRKPTRSLQRYAMAAAASVAGIAVVGWFALVNQESGQVNVADGGAPTAASRQSAAGSSTSGQSVPSLVPSPSVPSVSRGASYAQSDAEVSEMLRAHQEVSPTAALHGVASYIRTVSTQDDADER